MPLVASSHLASIACKYCVQIVPWCYIGRAMGCSGGVASKNWEIRIGRLTEE